MVDMNNFRSWAQGFRCYEQLKVLDDMNDTGSRAQASWYYEMVKAFIDLKDFELWYNGFRWNEQLIAIVEMNDSRFWAQGSRSYH